MSAAQEEEIERLYACLHTVMSERDASKQLAEQLQVSLFESRLKARQAIEQCKKDAIEVATEEAIREHLENANSMDELFRRQVSAASADKSMINAIRSSLFELHNLSESFKRLNLSPARCNVATLSEEEDQPVNAEDEQTPPPPTSNEESKPSDGIDMEKVKHIQDRLYAIMHSNEMMYFLEERDGTGDGLCTNSGMEGTHLPEAMKIVVEDHPAERTGPGYGATHSLSVEKS